MKLKMCLIVEKSTIENIIKNGPKQFEVNIHARYDGGQLNISATEIGMKYESESTDQFILSTEFEDPNATI